MSIIPYRIILKINILVYPWFIFIHFVLWLNSFIVLPRDIKRSNPHKLTRMMCRFFLYGKIIKKKINILWFIIIVLHNFHANLSNYKKTPLVTSKSYLSFSNASNPNPRRKFHLNINSPLMFTVFLLYIFDII